MTMPSVPLPIGFGSSGGPVMVPPNIGDNQRSVNAFVLTLPLPEDSPIPDAHEFNVQGQVLNSVGVKNNVLVAGSTLDVPDNNFGVITGVTLDISNMLATTILSWSLLIQDAAPQGYGNLTIFPRAAPFVSNGFTCKIRFQGAATIKVVYTCTDGGTYDIGAAYSGWFWPENADARWKAYGR
jgi:hypothetical protein